MSDGAIARYYGRNLGMIAGLFAFLQVLVSVSSARANLLLMRATQDVITNITNNIVQTPLNLLSDLVPTLIATYTAMVITGVIMLGFAFYAGRITAQEIGRHSGALAGFWVALISGTIWIVVSLLGAIILRADGTISGVLTSGAQRPAGPAGRLAADSGTATGAAGIGIWRARRPHRRGDGEDHSTACASVCAIRAVSRDTGALPASSGAGLSAAERAGESASEHSRLSARARVLSNATGFQRAGMNETPRGPYSRSCVSKVR